MDCIIFENITKSYGYDKLFDGLSMKVCEKEHIGLIGNNGTGKTTLLRMISGNEFPDEGRLVMPKGIRVGYLEQDTDGYDGSTVLDILKLPFSEVYEAIERLRTLEEQMTGAGAEETRRLLAEYGRLQSFMEFRNGYGIDSRILSVANGLRIDDGRLSDKIGSLSGGERTRVFLCRLLLEEPDLLLLDEPTNHLDIIAVGWLEKFLSEYKGTVVTVSHDRTFLDNTVGKIVEIEGKKAVEYAGNYSWYKEEKRKRTQIREKQYMNQQKEIKRLEASAKRMREWARQADNELMYKRAVNVERRIERMDKVDRPVSETAEMKMKLRNTSKSGREVIRLEAVRKSYSGRIVLDGVDLLVRKGEKVVIAGENGCGKTTLVNIAAGLLVPDSGSAVLGHGIKAGYLSQEVSFEDGERTLLDEARHSLETDAGRAHKVLAAYGFRGGDVMKKISSLSGGERKRLRFCTMMQREYNLLIMDEPTNHMDIGSREILEEALLDYPGTCMFISHDRFFIDRMSTVRYLLSGGRLVRYSGDYSLLLKSRNEEPCGTAENDGKPTDPAVLSKNRVAKIKETEEEIKRTEREIAGLVEEMSRSLPLEEIEALYDRKRRLDDLLLEMYRRWESLGKQ